MINDFEYFDEIIGLRTEHNPTTENGGLFLAHNLADKVTPRAMRTFILKMKNARLPNGLYRRSAHHNKRSVSHDELTAMFASSYLLKTTHRFEIWKQLKDNFGAYPAVIENWSDYLPYNPSNYYSWGQYAGSKFSYLFLPFYIINLVISISKQKQNTSSKLIYNTELKTLPKTFINNLMKKYVDNRLKKMYGDNFVFEMRKIYFNSEKPNFPLFQIDKV